jgi:hypothetical protein
LEAAAAILEDVVEEDLFQRDFASELNSVYFLLVGILKLEGFIERSAEIQRRREALLNRLENEYAE